MKKVLFLCTENSCRSQLAEAIVNANLGGKIRAYSAGTRPGKVHPMALEVLREIGLEPKGLRSKHVKEFEGDAPFDLVVTLCEDAKNRCPSWFGKGKVVHFGLPDPAKVTGDVTQRISAFRQVRDKIKEELLPFILRE